MKQTWFDIAARDGGEYEIDIYDEIGAYGVSAKDFVAELRKVPYGRAITVAVNSPGGSAFDGLAIFNALSRRKNVTTRIDGLAASISSVIALAGKKVKAAGNSLFMIHDPAGITAGTAADHMKTASTLDKVRDQIAGIYAGKTGMDMDDVLEAMREESWYTAAEALDAGFVDEITDEVLITNKFDLSGFRNAPAGAGKRADEPAVTTAKPKEKVNTMTEDKAVEEPKVTPPETKTETVEAQAQAAPEADVASELRERLDAQETEIKALRLERAKALVEASVADGKIQSSESVRAEWVQDAVENYERTKKRLDSILVEARGAEPLADTGRGSGSGDLLARFEAMNDNDPEKDLFLRNNMQSLLDSWRAREQAEFNARQ